MDVNWFEPTGQWHKAQLQTMQELFREEAVSWYCLQWSVQHSNHILTMCSSDQLNQL